MSVMIRFLGLLDLICYYCSIFYLKFVWYRQTVIGSNLALFRLTNVGFVLIIISSKAYCLSVLVTSNNFPVLHVKKIIFLAFIGMEYFFLEYHFSFHVCLV